MRTRIPRASAAVLAVGVLGWLGMPGPTGSSLPADKQAGAELAKKVAQLVEEDEDRLVTFFKHPHANPELAFRETKTAALVAKSVRTK